MAYLLIGKFVKPFGIKGELKVQFFIDDPAELEGFSAFYVKDKLSDSGYKMVTFKNLRVLGAHFVTGLAEVPDRNESELWRNREIFVDESELPDTREDEFYIKDLIKSKVFWDGEEKGFVYNVIEVAGQSILVVKMKAGNQVCVPFNNDYIGDIDHEKQTIEVHSLDDLL